MGSFLIRSVCLTIIICLLFKIQLPGQCNRQSDSLELVTFYNAMEGQNWIVQWNLNENLKSWHGVILDNEGCVNVLRLSNNNLNGKLFDLKLINLTELRLSGNLIHGSLPDFLHLPSLHTIDLGHNQITGEIPDFSNLPELKQFWIQFNSLTGKIPDFKNIPNLVQLICDNNSINGEIPDFKNLSNLNDLYCSNNLLSGNIPNFSNLPRLGRLICNNNFLSGTIPDFSNSDGLSELNCSYNNLVGNIPNFSNLPELQDLKCNNNLLTGPLPDFDNLVNLWVLYCHDNNLNSIPNFSYMPNLNWIDISNNKLTGQIPSFDKLPNLQGLDLYNNMLYGPIPDLSQNSPYLLRIQLHKNNLSGCFPEGMKFFCHLGLSADKSAGQNFTNNPGLPWGGDFMMFCQNIDQIGAPCDDGNINTFNDRIQEDCQCRGEEACNLDTISHHISLCEDEFEMVEINGLIYNQPGVFEDLIQVSDSCDYIQYVTITINPSPESNITIKDNFGQNVEEEKICFGDSIRLVASGDYQFLWNTGESGSEIETVSKEFNSFMVTITNEYGCKKEISTQINVLPLPEFEIEFIDIECLGESGSINLLNIKGGLAPYYISIDGGQTFFQNNKVVDLPSGFYSIHLMNSEGCISKAIDPIFIRPGEICPETCSYIPADYSISAEFGKTYILNVFSLGPKPLDYYMGNIYTSSNSISKLERINEEEISFQYTGYDIEPIEIKYEMCVPYCEICNLGTIFIVNENLKEITQTNLITPLESNNRALQLSEEPVDGSEIWIFNRWGQRIFHAKNYQNDWDASGYPGGVYYYVYKAYGFTIKNTLTVVK